jgi:hypothetical protein
MKRILIAGASGLGKGLIDIVEQRGEYAMVAVGVPARVIREWRSGDAHL